MARLPHCQMPILVVDGEPIRCREVMIKLELVNLPPNPDEPGPRRRWTGYSELHFTRSNGQHYSFIHVKLHSANRKSGRKVVMAESRSL